VRTALAAEIGALCAGAGLLVEWSEARLVAIDLPPGTSVPEGLWRLEDYQNAGRLAWEWSDAAAFQASPG